METSIIDSHAFHTEDDLVLRLKEAEKHASDFSLKF